MRFLLSVCFVICIATRSSNRRLEGFCGEVVVWHRLQFQGFRVLGCFLDYSELQIDRLVYFLESSSRCGLSGLIRKFGLIRSGVV